MDRKFADTIHARRNAGYGQSKLAAEQILAAASAQAGVRVAIVRVGQVGGARSGQQAWADQPWISALLSTAKTLGAFPSPVVPVDWVAVDDVATVLERVILLQQPASSSVAAAQPPQAQALLEVFNVVSKPRPWTALIDAVRELDSAAASEVVPLPEWVDRLRRLAETDNADIKTVPALRLLDFYQGIGSGHQSVEYATANAQAVSGLDLAAIDHELLVSWIKTWNLQ